MSTGLESQHNGYEPGGTVSTGPSPSDSTLHEELQRANEKLKAQLAVARREIERERQRAEQLQRESECRLDSELSELEHIHEEIALQPQKTETASNSGPPGVETREDDWAEDETLDQHAARGTEGHRSTDVDVSNFASESDVAEPEFIGDDTAIADETLSCRRNAARSLTAEVGACDNETGANVKGKDTDEHEAGHASTTEPCDDEDSIEAHIAAFMTRMRGGASGPVVQGDASPRRKPAASKAPRVQPAVEPVSAAPVPPPSEETPVVFAARSAPVAEIKRRPCADVRDLAAMRALANTQARMAIHTHSKHQLIRTLCMRAIGGVACLIVGIIALNLNFIDKVLDGCAMMVMVAGVYFLFLAAEDAKKIAAWLKTRPADGDHDEATFA